MRVASSYNCAVEAASFREDPEQSVDDTNSVQLTEETEEGEGPRLAKKQKKEKGKNTANKSTRNASSSSTKKDILGVIERVE